MSGIVELLRLRKPNQPRYRKKRSSLGALVLGRPDQQYLWFRRRRHDRESIRAATVCMPMKAGSALPISWGSDFNLRFALPWGNVLHSGIYACTWAGRRARGRLGVVGGAPSIRARRDCRGRVDTLHLCLRPVLHGRRLYSDRCSTDHRRGRRFALVLVLVLVLAGMRVSCTRTLQHLRRVERILQHTVHSAPGPPWHG